MAEAFAHQYHLEMVETRHFPDLPTVDEKDISPRFLKEHRILPLYEEEQGIVLAMANPGDQYAIAAVELACGKQVSPGRNALRHRSSHIYDRLYGSGKSAMGQIVESMSLVENAVDPDDIEHLKDMASEAPVIRLVNLMITRAVDSRASDIHIEPFENRLKVRYRIDGVMREVESPPARLSAAVISQVKIMARLNIAERRARQDGRIQLRVQGKEIDLRVSTVPTLYGESVVMRILDKASVVLSFDVLSWSGIRWRALEILELPHGILLVLGPTGSGKADAVYRVATAQHPGTENSHSGRPGRVPAGRGQQIQIKPQIDLTFANALRAIVRQDPDIIMIGEMRDLETAGIAVQSALTGHLVLSRLHTNDAASSVTRLLDMGVEDYLLTATVNGILAQRLVRMLCPQCRQPYPALPEMVEQLRLHRFTDAQPVQLFKAIGCDHCGGIGYLGRMAIMEFLIMSDEIRRLLLKHADAGDIQRVAQEQGMDTMYEDGLRKAVAGLTTVEEVLRVTQED
ncbi:MAG: ATPase, T2SS/T4P/T4SS family [Candidatus Competibacteraceae bacterium]